MAFRKITSSLAAFAVMVAASASANPATTVVSSQPFQFTDAHIAIAVQALERSLKDPGSAQYGRAWTSLLSYADGGQNLAVCGIVNARNSYGGYTGNKVYIVIFNRQATYAEAVFDAGSVCQQYAIIR